MVFSIGLGFDFGFGFDFVSSLVTVFRFKVLVTVLGLITVGERGGGVISYPRIDNYGPRPAHPHQIKRIQLIGL